MTVKTQQMACLHLVDWLENYPLFHLKKKEEEDKPPMFTKRKNAY